MGNGPVEIIKRLRKEFRAAHVKGMNALRSGDYQAFGEAIETERKLFEQQKSLVDRHLRVFRKR